MDAVIVDRMEKTKEENAIVLDFLPNGYPFDERPMYMKTPIVQALGKKHSTNGFHLCSRCFQTLKQNTKKSN